MTIFPRVKVQFLALKDEISDLLSKGYTVLDIHNILVEQGKITMSYFSLNNYINLYIHGKEPRKRTKKTSAKNESSKKFQTKIIGNNTTTFGTKNYNTDENI